jgi:NADPH:quinone reductase-like Zn-dependent oxidoreductase
VAKIEVGENKIVEGGPSTPPRLKMLHLNATWYKVLAEVATMVDAGQIKPEVSQVLRLEEARKGHELIEGRHTRGKIVLQVVG